MAYSLHDDITKDEADFVLQELVKFADQFTGPRNYGKFGVVLRDADGKAVGGITCSLAWDWLLMDALWLPENMRGQGFGHQLLDRAEAVAKARGCKFAILNTFEFEARGFYESHGYTVRSQTDGFPSGHTQYHMAKGL